MAWTNRLQGCYRRLLMFLLVVITVIFAAGIFLYQRLGGPEGARYWAAERALNSVEEHLLKQGPDGNWMRKPDGISEEGVRSQFQKVRAAIDNWGVDLIQLDRVLREYQDKYQKTKPSTGEAIEFLNNLESAILFEEDK